MKQYVGLWWTPAVPDQKVTGTLTIQNDGRPDLDLACQTENAPAGSLPAFLVPRDHVQGTDTKVMVHGQSRSGILFTLYDGFVRSLRLGMGATTSASIPFNGGFRGGCIDDPSTLPVTELYMRYPGMNAWLGAQPFHVQYGDNMKQVSIAHTIPEQESWQIDEKRRLILTWQRRGPRHSAVQTRIGMTALPWLGIEYASAVTPAKASDDASNVGQLLSLLLGSPTTPRQLEMISPQCKIDVGETTHHRELRVLAGHFKLPQSFRKWMTHDVLLPFSVVQDQFENLLQRWFALRHECWGVIVPYLAGQRSPAPMAESRFFDFAAAAESLHRHFRPNEKNFSDEEARAICKGGRRYIPKERRNAFCSALRRVNELTYQDRLERLLERFPTLTSDVIGDSGEQNTFCKLVRELRNVEAHRLRRTSESNVGGSKLVRIAAKLKTILDAWILAEIGIADETIEQAMRKNQSYWFYASRTTWPWNIPSKTT